MSPSTAKIGKRDNSLGLRCGRPRPLERKDRLKVKKILIRDAIKAEIKKISARGFRRLRPFKTRNRPQEW